MRLFGLSVEDIASLLGVIGSVSGLIFYLFRVIVVQPMSDKSNALNKSIESLTDEVKQMRQIVSKPTITLRMNCMSTKLN
ncbi:hypothetical protein [Lentilactobacillus kosonis]|uniref:Uncharacterized protein n=1 Tax=Lentilactobacillus kosonis TaxID=2810561 RepID=A0A401FPP8_9LACO|nr:hypothetical protein [Lentilactobacillus kosonis]GAY74365.1 hypothetical protein NBRC111893_2511 [Lentilactobacillus kosonis]